LKTWDAGNFGWFGNFENKERHPTNGLLGKRLAKLVLHINSYSVVNFLLTQVNLLILIEFYLIKQRTLTKRRTVCLLEGWRNAELYTE